jgi:capsular polysaccharide biosynthesis protein
MLGAVRRRALLVVVVVVVALGVGAGVRLSQGTTYRATTVLLVGQHETSLPGNEGLLTQQKLNLLAVTYAEIAHSPTFVEDSVKAANVSSGDAHVGATPVLNASIVQVSVTAGSSSRATSVAGAIGSHLTDVIEHGGSSVPSAAGMTVSTLARPSSTRSSAHTGLVLLVALIVGLALGITLALLLESE